MKNTKRSSCGTATDENTVLDAYANKKRPWGQQGMLCRRLKDNLNHRYKAETSLDYSAK
jgi:hypothetical protein